MPVLLDGVSPDHAPLAWMGSTGILPGRSSRLGSACLEIGLVNNMPDAALQATERQFVNLLAAASGERQVRMHLFSLPSVPRGEAATAHIRSVYADIDALGRRPLDALIVTGAEPRAASLAEEPYWDGLTRLIDWAENNTVSTLWSCLAAHAAVLHLDGIGRHRLPSKRSGVYSCAAVADHPLLAGLPARMNVPHSRWNDLRAEDLTHHGYEILTRSPEAGVNLFVKRRRSSLFVFLQGHPEYDADSIAREYRRDIGRYLRAEQADYPDLPADYFSIPTEAALRAFRTVADHDRHDVSLSDLPRALSLRAGLTERWHDTVIPLCRNWLDLVAATKG